MESGAGRGGGGEAREVPQDAAKGAPSQGLQVTPPLEQIPLLPHPSPDLDLTNVC